jgi:(2Fe-2S) ferredoxin
VLSEKNHGKIFEQNVNCIEIWDPVCLFVSVYEKAIKIYSNSFHLTVYANMTKEKAREIVNSLYQAQSLNEENTNISKISKSILTASALNLKTS